MDHARHARASLCAVTASIAKLRESIADAYGAAGPQLLAFPGQEKVQRIRDACTAAVTVAAEHGLPGVDAFLDVTNPTQERSQIIPEQLLDMKHYGQDVAQAMDSDRAWRDICLRDIEKAAHDDPQAAIRIFERHAHLQVAYQPPRAISAIMTAMWRGCVRAGVTPKLAKRIGGSVIALAILDGAADALQDMTIDSGMAWESHQLIARGATMDPPRHPSWAKQLIRETQSLVTEDAFAYRHILAYGTARSMVANHDRFTMDTDELLAALRVGWPPSHGKRHADQAPPAHILEQLIAQRPGDAERILGACTFPPVAGSTAWISMVANTCCDLPDAAEIATRVLSRVDTEDQIVCMRLAKRIAPQVVNVSQPQIALSNLGPSGTMTNIRRLLKQVKDIPGFLRDEPFRLTSHSTYTTVKHAFAINDQPAVETIRDWIMHAWDSHPDACREAIAARSTQPSMLGLLAIGSACRDPRVWESLISLGITTKTDQAGLSIGALSAFAESLVQAPEAAAMTINLPSCMDDISRVCGMAIRHAIPDQVKRAKLISAAAAANPTGTMATHSGFVGSACYGDTWAHAMHILVTNHAHGLPISNEAMVQQGMALHAAGIPVSALAMRGIMCEQTPPIVRGHLQRLVGAISGSE